MLVVVSALALVVDLLGGVDPATFLALLCHDLELVLELGGELVFLDNVVVVQLLALHHLDVDLILLGVGLILLRNALFSLGTSVVTQVADIFDLGAGVDLCAPGFSSSYSASLDLYLGTGLLVALNQLVLLVGELSPDCYDLCEGVLAVSAPF